METNTKIENIRGFYRAINDFKKGNKPRCNIANDETGYLVTDYHSILASVRNFSLVYTMYMLGRQKYIQQSQ